MLRCRCLAYLPAALFVACGAVAAQDASDPEPIRAVLWVGGFAHDFDAYAQVMGEFLPQRIPIEMPVVREGSFLEDPAAGELDVIVMNHCFEKAEGVLTETERQKLLDLIRGGVGVVAVHASYYSFLDWEALRDLYGARFTQHGSSEIQVEVRMVDRSHPITRDLPETFVVRTELYESTPLEEDCHLLAVAREAGTEQEHPSAWTREYGQGRVATILPAHWPDAYAVEPFQQLIANATLWAAGRLDQPEANQETP